MKLLLAEDEKELSKAIVAILEHYEYEVDAAYDGEEALSLATAGQYDGIILDIMMPKMSGIEVLTSLRAQGDTSPILMLTAKSEVEDRVLGLDQGANDYLTKPFAFKELIARIKAMVRSNRQLLPNEIHGTDFIINREKAILEGKDSSVSLNNQEFQILELFLCNPDTPFTKHQLWEKVWDQKESNDGIVKIYISYLRNKLEAVKSQAVITEVEPDRYTFTQPSEVVQ